MATARWMEQSRTAPIHEVILEAGLSKKGPKGYEPCPVCSADCRGSSDKRGPVFVAQTYNGWRCYACDEKGDALNLVSLRLYRAKLKDLQKEDRYKVREWFAERSWCEPWDPNRKSGWKPLETPVILPEYPPQDEVQRLWDACLPVNAGNDVPGGMDHAAMAFMQERHWFPGGLARLDVVRLTPHPNAYDWPDWWPRGRADTWRLVTPAYDHNGELVSLHARAIVSPSDGAPKTLWPKGYDALGLIMADAQGRKLLQRKAKPRLVIIDEGLTDLVATSLAKSCLRGPVAILSCASGGFGALADVVFPKWTSVYVATDEGDGKKTGDRYAKAVATALSPHPVLRLPISKVM